MVPRTALVCTVSSVPVGTQTQLCWASFLAAAATTSQDWVRYKRTNNRRRRRRWLDTHTHNGITNGHACRIDCNKYEISRLLTAIVCPLSETVLLLAAAGKLLWEKVIVFNKGEPSWSFTTRTRSTIRKPQALYVNDDESTYLFIGFESDCAPTFFGHLSSSRIVGIKIRL